MASTKTRTVETRRAHLLCAPLSRGLTIAHRERIARHLHALLAWQRSLRTWPALADAPDATPFVTVYAHGVLRGCFGSHDGSPAERVTRAFLRAMEDSRYGGVRPEERDRLSLVLSYVRSLRPIDPERVSEQLAAGSEGVGVIRPGKAPVLLLPHVARDLGAGPRELLAALAHKSGVPDWHEARLFAVRTDDIVVRSGERRAAATSPDPCAAAAAWLARIVGADGAVAFAVDARHRRVIATGTMHHGRAAVALRALEAQGGNPRSARRAKAWLQREIERALGGHVVLGWPSEPAMVAGTLALAHMAGLDVRPALAEAARDGALRSSPWYAAQVVAALGDDAPALLWRACVDDLAGRPWAPWTLVAARARRDAEVTGLAAPALCASIRVAAPYKGGCSVATVPETAVTALVIEALDGLPDPHARQAVSRGRAFLRALHLVGDSLPAPLDPVLACGAFPASPVVDILRCDVVGHALLAMRRSTERP
jgi:AMMECR1 domain-containing protein